MMSYSKLYPTERKIKTSSNMHIMGTKTFRNTIICKLIDTDNKGIFVGYFKGITQMIIMRMRKNNIISRSEEHTSELQSLRHLVCRLLLEKKKKNDDTRIAQ